MDFKVLTEKSISRIEYREINFSWRIEGFSLLCSKNKDFVESPLFPKTGEDHSQWCLQLYPYGDSLDSNDYVSVYVEWTPNDDISKVAKFKLNFLNSKGYIKTSKYSSEQCLEYGESWGYSKVIERNNLVSQLPDDVLIIDCSIKWKTDFVHVSNETTALAEPNAQNKVLNDFRQLLDKGSLSDVCLLASDNTKFSAHKCILMARSPVFSAMFQQNMRESNESVVKIDDINAEVLKILLEFIYSGKFEVNENDVWLEGLLAAADKYDIEDLKKSCELALGKQLSVDNAVRYLLLADHHSAKTLKTQVVEFISTHLKQVLGSEAMKNLTVAQKALFHDVLQVLAEKI